MDTEKLQRIEKLELRVEATETQLAAFMDLDPDALLDLRKALEAMAEVTPLPGASVRELVEAAQNFIHAIQVDVEAQGVFYATLSDEQSAKHIPTNAATLKDTGAEAQKAEAALRDALSRFRVEGGE